MLAKFYRYVDWDILSGVFISFFLTFLFGRYFCANVNVYFRINLGFRFSKLYSNANFSTSFKFQFDEIKVKPKSEVFFFNFKIILKKLNNIFHFVIRKYFGMRKHANELSTISRISFKTNFNHEANNEKS